MAGKSEKVAFVEGTKCIGCGGCKRNCKFDALYRGKSYYIVDEEKCVACGVCAKICPAEAIELVCRKEAL